MAPDGCPGRCGSDRAAYPYKRELDQSTQKPLPLGEIQGDHADADHGSAGDRQFGHHSLQAPLAFEVAEFAFDGDAVLFVLPLPLFFFPRHGPGAAQRFAAQPDVAFFAPSAVGPGLIDFVGMDAGRVVAEALPE